MIEVTRSLAINANPEAVWQSIADFGAVSRFIKTIKECTTEGPDGVGQLRHLILEDDSLTTSKLAVLDNTQHLLTYEIVTTALPMDNYSSTMKVEANGDTSCTVNWCSRFEPAGVLPEKIEDYIGIQLVAALQNLKALHE
jgi:mxaD protein